MFNRDHVPVLLRSLKLSLEDDDDDGGTLRFCSTTFRIGLLSFERAESITDMPVIAQCYGQDRLPLWNVDLVRFAAPKQQYTLELRGVPDMPPMLILPLVTIEKAKVWRPKPTQRDLALEFITKHEVAHDAKDLRDILTLWIAGAVYATFLGVQLSLDMADETATTRNH